MNFISFDKELEILPEVGTWYREGKLHREDGPAIIWPNGEKRWYRDGKRHRDNGPAIIHSDGTRLWYRDGLRHREDGPAVIGSSGTKHWYREGKKLTEAEFNKLHRPDCDGKTVEIDGITYQLMKMQT